MGITINKRKSTGEWYVWISHKGKRSARKVGKNYNNAVRVANEYEKQLILGTFDFTNGKEKSKDELMFGDFCDDYIENIAKHRLKYNSWNSYQKIINLYLKPDWKKRTLISITRQDVKKLLLKRQASGIVISNIKICISAIYAEAIEREIVTVNPAHNLGRFFKKSKPQKKTQFLGKEQATALLNQTKQDRAESLSANNHWQPALWWATEALKVDPYSHAAKEVFMTSLANTAVGLVTIYAGYKDKLPAAKRILERGYISQEEAEFVADIWIRVYYLEWLQKQYAPLLKRFNKGEIRRASRLSDSDIKSARDMALALGDELLPDQKSPFQWKYIINSEAASFMASAITVQREALIILLQASIPSDWQKTCTRLHALFKNFPKEQELAASFEQMANDRLDEVEFCKYRDNFQLTFAKNASQMIWTRSLLREPACLTQDYNRHKYFRLGN